MQIQKTKEYKKFKFLLGNRPLNRSNLKKVTQSIAIKNMLEINPIIVNSKLEIIDGQHRFQIAKENGFPIYYFVLEDGGLRDVHALNNISRKWNSEDYIKSYAIQGDVTYRKLLKFMEDNGIVMSIAVILLKGNAGGREVNQIKSGSFKFTAEEMKLAEERLSVFNSVIAFYEGPPGHAQYLVKACCILVSSGNAQKVIDGMDSRNVKFKHQASVVEYLREFETILNWKKREGHLVRIF